ncbi:hypothetical protein HPB47_002947 [Ixodes persulcatus]|uniref:Uncharacterized protein n=1 Tax=Ixodes persulcatus TaxID=34615 RepID=A0AC60QZB2_IXOPE|nr:hypothetical protein HPB47_002947 [Ixodes persulcatus]
MAGPEKPSSRVNPVAKEKTTVLFECWQNDILNRTREGRPLPWIKTLRCYYYRDQWELFDLDHDSREAVNLAEDPGHSAVLEALQTQLFKWQQITHDPWMCAPGGVLQDSGLFKAHPQCFPLLNDL